MHSMIFTWTFFLELKKMQRDSILTLSLQSIVVSKKHAALKLAIVDAPLFLNKNDM